jgi:putative SOS response-associated peptidase YedK
VCNRARFSGEPEALHERFGSNWAADVVRPNVSLAELYPKSRAYIVREERDRRVVDVLGWGVLPDGGNPGTKPRTSRPASRPPGRWRST